MFERKDIAIADTYGEYAYMVNTVDMLDFGLIGFNKSIRTIIQKRIEINSKYPLIKLVDFPSEIRKGKSITAKNAISGNYKVVAGGKDFAYTHNEYNRDENTITISASGANAGFVNFWKEKIFASDCTTIRGKTELATKYIFVYLQSMQQALFDLARGSAQPHVYPDDIKNFKIPLPPPSIQQQIIDECQKIDDEYENSRMAIETYRQKIADIFNELEIVYKTQGGGGLNLVNLGDICQSYIGLNYKPEHINDNGILVLRSSNIKNGKLDFNDQVRVKLNINDKYFVKNKDVLICVRNGSKKLLGKSAYLDTLNEPMTFGAFMAICRSNKFSKWIYLWTQSKHYAEQIEKISSTVSINQLTQKTLLSFKIPVLQSYDEMQKIIAKAELYEQKIEIHTKVINESQRKKEAILAKYL